MRLKTALRRPSPASVISIVALFVALGGTATAGYVITSSNQLGKNVVKSKQIKNSSIAYKDLSRSLRKKLKKSKGVSSLPGGPIVSAAPGPKGDRGPQGPTGDVGKQGPAAQAAVRYAASVAADGTITSQFSDGAVPTSTRTKTDADPETGDVYIKTVYTFDGTTSIVAATATLTDASKKGFIRTEVDNSARTVTVFTGTRTDNDHPEHGYNLVVAGARQ